VSKRNFWQIMIVGLVLSGAAGVAMLPARLKAAPDPTEARIALAGAGDVALGQAAGVGQSLDAVSRRLAASVESGPARPGPARPEGQAAAASEPEPGQQAEAGRAGEPGMRRVWVGLAGLGALFGSMCLFSRYGLKDGRF